MNATAKFRMPDTRLETPNTGDGIVLDLAEIVRIFRRRMLLVAIVVILFVGAGAAMLSRATPQYTATALVMLGERGRFEGNFEELLTGLAIDSKVIEGEIAIMQSGRLLARVAETLALDTNPEFGGEGAAPSPVALVLSEVKAFVKAFLTGDLSGEAAPAGGAAGDPTAVDLAAAAEEALLGRYGPFAGALRGRLSVRQEGNSYLVSITATAADPRLAAAIVNTVVDQYIDDQLQLKFRQMRRVVNWLNERLGVLKSRLEESEAASLQFRAGLLGIEGADEERLVQEIREMTSSLIAAQSRHAQAQAQRQQIEAVVAAEGTDAASRVLGSEMLSALRVELSTLRQEAEDLIQRFGTASPKLVSTQRRIDSLSAEIDREVTRLVEALRNEERTAEAAVAFLRTRLSTLEQASVAHAADWLALRRLDREMETNRIRYSDFLARQKEVAEIADLQQADARVVSYAKPPGAPSSPRTSVALALSLVAGGLIGVGLALLLEFLNSAFRTDAQITRLTGLPVLSGFSKVRFARDPLAALDQIARTPRSAVADEARTLRNHLFTRFSPPPKVIGITSCLPEDGKEAVAMLVAWACAQAGKSCVMVDVDTHWPRGRRDPAEADLISVLRDEAPLDDALRRHGPSGVHVLSVQQDIDDPGGLFASDRAGVLVGMLRERFDVVIVNMPPMFQQSDAIVVGRQLDLLLFAIRWNASEFNPVRHAIDVLRAVGIRDMAAVMTSINRRKEASYRYAGYSRIYRSYRKYHRIR